MENGRDSISFLDLHGMKRFALYRISSSMTSSVPKMFENNI
jgi:hypothetical protein